LLLFVRVPAQGQHDLNSWFLHRASLRDLAIRLWTERNTDLGGTCSAFTCPNGVMLAPASGFGPAFREERSLLFLSAVSRTQAAASTHSACGFSERSWGHAPFSLFWQSYYQLLFHLRIYSFNDAVSSSDRMVEWLYEEQIINGVERSSCGVICRTYCANVPGRNERTAKALNRSLGQDSNPEPLEDEA
jgi:hypothetical protein